MANILLQSPATQRRKNHTARKTITRPTAPTIRPKPTQSRMSATTLMIAVQDKGDIARLSSLNAQIMGTDSDPFYGAPTVIVVLAQAGNRNGVQDASLVMGNLMNAAHALGLGSCWINRALETFELPEGRELLAKWGVEGDWIGVGYCILGYPDGPAGEAKPRKEGYVRIIR